MWRWPRWHASITTIPLASNSGFSKRIGARFVNVSLLSSAQSVLDKKKYQFIVSNRTTQIFFGVLEQIIHFNPKLLFSSHYTCQSKAIGSRKISPRRKDFHSFDVEVEDLKSVELCFSLSLYINVKNSALLVQFLVAISLSIFCSFLRWLA